MKIEHIFQVLGLLGIWLIILVSLVPGPFRPQTSMSGYTEHFFVYAVVAGCFALGWRSRLFQAGIVISAFAIAGMLETLQSFVPGRSSDTASTIVSGARGFWGVFIAISAAKCRQSHHSLKAELSSSASPWRAEIAPTQY